MSRNATALTSFINYCCTRPEERFWQALRNWSGYQLVLVSNDYDPDANPRVEDTFHWEGSKGMEADITSALAARDVEIERLRGWQEGLSRTTVAWSEQRLARDAEVREVLEGLATYRNPQCWCPPDTETEPHSEACRATTALYTKLQPKEVGGGADDETVSR